MTLVQQRFFTATQLAVIFGKSHRWVMRNYPDWRKYGVVPRQPGKTLLFDINEINRMLEKTKVCA